MATNAVAFDGSTQYGTLANFSGLDGLDNYTVEGWVKNHTSSAAYSPFYCIDDGSSTRFSKLSTENGTGNAGFNMSTDYAGTNADGYESDSRFTTSTWHHFAIVHDTTAKKTAVFIDGVENNNYNLQQTGTSTIVDSSGMDFLLAINRTGTARKFQGSIGGFVRVWRRALTGAEIYHNYQYTLDPANEDSALVVNCNFSEGSGATLDNDATAGQDISLTGSPSWETGPTLSAKSYTNSYHFNQVAQSSDDCEEETGGGTPDITSSDLEIILDGTTAQDVGIRFDNVAVPAGATIESAYMRFVGDETQSSGTGNVDIYGDDVDDSVTFTTSANSVSGRTKTTAKVDWDGIAATSEGTIATTPDIKTIIQEIVDRGGWATGQAISLLFVPGGSNAIRTYEAFDGQKYSAPMLEIEYSESSSSTASVSPIVIEASIPLIGANLNGFPNLLLNHSFENDTAGDLNIPSGWTSYGTSGLDYKGVSTGWSYDGSQSFEMSHSTTVDTGIKIQIPGLTSGQQYTLSAYVKTDADVDNVNLTLDTNQDGAGGSSSNTTNITASQEGRFSVTLTADSTNMNIFIGLGSFGAASDGTAYIDAVMFEWGSSATTYGPTSENIQTASVSPIAVSAAIPAITATYVYVNTATVSPVGMTATLPEVTASYVYANTASVAPITATATLPEVTATYTSIQTASVAPITATATLPEVSATYVYTQTASVSPITATATLPEITASYVFVATASVAPIGISATLPEVTATFASVQTATVSPVGAIASLPEVTATHVSIWTGAVSPIGITATIPAVTATYTSVLSASVSPIGLTATIPAITATYAAVKTASVSPITLTATLPEVTGTYSSGTVAVVSPIGITATLPEVTATYTSIQTASISPIGITATLPEVTGTYASIQTASVTPLLMSATLPTVTATFASIQTVSIDPIVIQISIPEITGTFAISATVSPILLTLTPVGITATYTSILTAEVTPIGLEITIPEITPTAIAALTASVSPISILATLPEITAIGSSPIWQTPNPIDWYTDAPNPYSSANDGDWYTENSGSFSSKDDTDWYTK